VEVAVAWIVETTVLNTKISSVVKNNEDARFMLSLCPKPPESADPQFASH
jgi:hypothetical protein